MAADAASPVFSCWPVLRARPGAQASVPADIIGFRAPEDATPEPANRRSKRAMRSHMAQTGQKYTDARREL
jgi:hypothetical protein